MSKSDLKIRTTFHYNRHRIEAHVMLCMISLLIMRILEYRVKPSGFSLNPTLEVIKETNSALIGNAKTNYLIPQKYSREFKTILRSTAS